MDSPPNPSGFPIWQSMLAALGPLGIIGWAWKFWEKRSDDKKEKHRIDLLHEAEEDAAIARARSNLDDAQKEWFDGMRQELKDARAELKEVRIETRLEIAALKKDRDQGWNLARGCYDLLVRERHARANLLQTQGMTDPLPPLPNLEDIEGRKP